MFVASLKGIAPAIAWTSNVAPAADIAGRLTYCDRRVQTAARQASPVNARPRGPL